MFPPSAKRESLWHNLLRLLRACIICGAHRPVPHPFTPSAPFSP
ncbi:hypothetical protein BSIN_1226 [Burkholderia singularis]|uniref:Uncharacterized protein n=1 Tax=Burkholderia singularis TaxID=1503053 RepID=A0A238HCU4_9BURK|nr:hypothetical protein BSIN_1226 [Burkholderia singularis]